MEDEEGEEGDTVHEVMKDLANLDLSILANVTVNVTEASEARQAELEKSRREWEVLLR